MRRRTAGLLIGLGILGLASPAMAGDGDLDTTWGSNGFATIPFAGSDSGRWVGNAGNGRILVVGQGTPSGGSNNQVVIARFSENGSLDTSCDGDGVAVLSLPNYTASGMSAVALSDGSFVVVGTATNGSSVDHILAARFDASCQPVTSFGNQGVVLHTARVGAGALTVASDSSGRIVIGGYVWMAPADGGAQRHYVIRLLGNGTLDTAFGTAGTYTGASGDDGTVNDLTVVAGDRVVFSGVRYGSSTEAITARLTSAGVLDTTFAISGRRLDQNGVNGSSAQALAQRSDGRLIVLGVDTDASYDDHGYLLCLTADGAIDTACGASGHQSFSPSSDSVSIGGADIDPSGRIVVSGTSFAGAGFRIFVTRRLADGSLDSTFGQAGYFTSPNFNGRLFGDVIDPIGRPLATGFDYDQVSDTRTQVLRLQASTTTSTTSTTTTVVATTLLQPDSTLAASSLPATGQRDSTVSVLAFIMTVVGYAIVLIRRWARVHDEF